MYAKNKQGQRTFPLWKGYDVWQIAQRAMHGAFAVTAPTLVFQSALDETIDPKGARRFVAGVSSDVKEHVWLEQSPHVCTAGPEKEAVFERTIAFLKDVRSAGE